MILAKEGDEFKLVAMMIIGGGALVINGVKRMLKARRVQDTARHRIAHAPQGNVELEGFAWCLDQPVQNSSGQYCAYYNCELQEEVGSGKNRRWVTRWTYNHDAGFATVDQTGAVLVLHDGADVDCESCSNSWGSIMRSKNSNGISSLVQKGYGKVPSGGWFSGTFRLVENYITLGSPCYVQGRLSSDGIQSAKIKNQQVEVFYEYIKKRPPGEIHNNLKFDIDGNGVVTHQEASGSFYRVANNILEKGIMPEAVSSTPVGTPLKVYGKIVSDQDHKLIIAGMHEHHFLKKVGSSNILQVVGGAILIAGGVVLLIGRLNGNF